MPPIIDPQSSIFNPMIPYSRDPQSTVPSSAVKILGLGGAGANMLERIALDGHDPSNLVVLNTDIRTLEASLAKQKIQLGTNLTKGLGTGGDPDLGQQAVLEAEEALRAQIRGCRIVFLCAGLGGGTGSGAAPIITRIAREEGAFVVVFATMPFVFEGKRRRDQAEAALNQLSVLSNALITFDNNRMGELVVAKQGIHEAFAAADAMVGEAIKAVIRLVTRPGLIHVGLDDLMSALRTTRSRCLFGSGIASGADRASKALKNALSSPLLDQGALLKETGTVLVHLCGGEDLTLFEVELLMQDLQKHVPEKAQLLFGAAVDSSMKDALSITLISSLPEEALVKSSENPAAAAPKAPAAPPPPAVVPPPLPPAPAAAALPAVKEPEAAPDPVAEKAVDLFAESTPSLFDEPIVPDSKPEEEAKPSVAIAEFVSPAIPDPEPVEEPAKAPEVAVAPPAEEPASEPSAPPAPTPSPEPPPSSAPPKLKLGIKGAPSNSELGLDSAPRGRFEGESPNVFEGEDLDLPPFLRRKK